MSEPRSASTFWLLWRNRQGKLRWHACWQWDDVKTTRSICTNLKARMLLRQADCVEDVTRYLPTDSEHPTCRFCLSLAGSAFRPPVEVVAESVA